MDREFQTRRRVGDSFRPPSLRDATRKRYLCIHVKSGQSVAVRLDTSYGIVAACDQCKDPETMQITDDCEVI